MTASASATVPIDGYGLTLRPWDEDLVRQMAAWSERGFPYHPFDMGFLRDPHRAAATLSWARDSHTHLHFVACEGDTAVGRVSVNLRDDAGLYLWSVHVPPEHENRGVARRMLAALIEWLERECPSRDFILTSNTFAEHAHRCYLSLGFRITETRWQYDRALAELLWKVPQSQREPVAHHIRFMNGRWEVRTHVMERTRGTAMDPGPSSPHPGT